MRRRKKANRGGCRSVCRKLPSGASRMGKPWRVNPIRRDDQFYDSPDEGVPWPAGNRSRGILHSAAGEARNATSQRAS